MDQLTARENISIADLRLPMNIEAFPQMIPGALRIAKEEMEERHSEIPRDSVLYCSLPKRSDRAPVCIVNAWRASRKED
jgi:rhodanese-related sulfurtransferase